MNFRDILLDGLIKFGYLFVALFITIFSVVMMTWGGEYVLLGALILVFGNVALRLIFELVMLLVGVWKNLTDIENATADINEKLGAMPGEVEKEEPAQPEAPEAEVALTPVVSEAPKPEAPAQPEASTLEAPTLPVSAPPASQA